MNMFNYYILQKMREEHNYSQEYVAKELGISRPTYVQLEKGEREITLPEAQKLALMYGVTFENFLKGIEEPKIEVVLEKKIKQGKKAGKDIRISVPQRKLDKFKEVLLYILGKVGAKLHVGETVIYKLLYFIDFDYYEIYEEQLIGATYIKNHHGPTPIEFIKIVSDMEDSGEVEKVKSKYFRYPQTKYLPKREPDLSKLSAVELKHIDNVLDRLSDKNANEISELSHRDVPWITAETGKPLDYEAVFYRTPETSVRSYEEDQLP